MWMNDTLLFQTLCALSSKEHEQLKHALQSPLFNPSRLAAKCLELHGFFIGKGFENKLSGEEAFAALFPNKIYNKAMLENTMSALMDGVRAFVAWQMTMKQRGETGTRLEMARFYQQRGLPHRFLQTIQQVRRLQEKKPVLRSSAAYFQEFELEMEVYRYHAVLNDLQNDLNLPATLDSFIQYYLAQGLELGLRLEHQSNMTALDFSRYDGFLDSIKEFAAANGFFKNSLLEMLCLAYQLLSHEAPETIFLRYVRLLNEEGDSLEFSTHHFLATMARHYCLSKINHGEPAYRPILLALYKTHLAKGLLDEKGKIPHNTLLNIVNMAIGENEAEWATSMLEAHRHRIIGSDSQAASYFFIRSFLAFNQKDLEMAASALDEAFLELNRLEARSHFKDFNLKLMARKLEIQILYETEPDSTLLYDRLNAHKMFVHRNRYLTSTHKTLHNNFIDLMKQLILPACQTDSKRAEKLHEKLQRPGFLIADRKWVTEKVQALMG
jgi:hypothetical protein